MLRIGLHDVAGEPASRREVTGQLTDLAEVCLASRRSRRRCRRSSRARATPRAGLTVLGLGSLGAREMRYGSDLDLVFLYGADGESSDRRRPPRVVRPRLAALHLGDGGDAGGGAPLPGRHAAAPVGRAGAAGDVVDARSSATTSEEAAGWERVALLRARVVYSERGRAERARRRAASWRRSRSTARSTRRVPRRPARACATRVENERGQRAGRLAPPAVRSGRHHGRRVPGRARPAAPRRRSRACARRSTADVAGRAWSRSAGPRRSLDDYAVLRRVDAAPAPACSTAPRTSCRPRDLPTLARSLGSACRRSWRRSWIGADGARPLRCSSECSGRREVQGQG